MNTINERELKEELAVELENILSYWIDNTIDNEYGGFVGKIDDKDQIVHNSEKGSVLNARILWTFSAAYRKNPKIEYLKMADRAFQYLFDYCRDKDFGGIYWSVDYKGNPLNTRKQIYGQAFAIYGLSEYFKVTQSIKVLEWAIELFEIIEKYSYDVVNEGYIEALNQNWEPIEDLKLSAKDANEKKSMNTHLHILEAYANLVAVWNDEMLQRRLYQLIELFKNKIVDSKSGHQHLFFDENWAVKSNIISYGHDIEASWLLYEAAVSLGDAEQVMEMKNLAITLIKATEEGLLTNGGLAYEYEHGHFDEDKHWWVQAEAMVGFYNGYWLTNNVAYLEKTIEIWEYVKKYLITDTGEWYWGLNGRDNTPMLNQDKVGFWKCPYHNARACMEIIFRIERV